MCICYIKVCSHVYMCIKFTVGMGKCIQVYMHNFMLYLVYAAKSLVGLVQYLFSLPCVQTNKLAFLSNNICQDPLENFFGVQRQRGGTCDNPSVGEFLKNTATLRVVNSFCRGPRTGNCRGSKQLISGKENTPLQRRRKNDRR